MEMSYENTRRTFDLLSSNEEEIRKLTDSLFEDMRIERKDITQKINTLLIETSKRTEQSLYEICYTTRPEINPIDRVNYDENNIPFAEEKEYEITLKPIEFEFEKGPGYWKNKYLRLKEKIKKLLEK